MLQQQASGLSRSDEYRLRKQLSSVERKMESQRKKIDDLQGRMLKLPPSDFEALGKLQVEVDGAQAQLDTLELEWLEISEQLEA